MPHPKSTKKDTPKTLPPPLETHPFKVVRCGCKGWFCEDCCTALGLKLRDRLVPRLAEFGGLLMWTLTIDPLLFANPEAAFVYARDNRCVSRLVRELRRRGHLLGPEWFAVVEWQKRTEMPHWHVLLNARHVPFDAVTAAWDRFRPKAAGPPVGDRPPFGSVRFSMREFADHRHAAGYACKYLIKHPDHGYPAWVMGFKGTIRRYTTSRGFWQEPPREEPPAKPSTTEPTWPERKPRERGATVGDRVAKCGRESVLLHREWEDLTEGEVVERRRFRQTVREPIASIADRLGREPDRRGLFLTVPEAGRLLRGSGPAANSLHNPDRPPEADADAAPSPTPGRRAA